MKTKKEKGILSSAMNASKNFKLWGETTFNDFSYESFNTFEREIYHHFTSVFLK